MQRAEPAVCCSSKSEVRIKGAEIRMDANSSTNAPNGECSDG
jgi:hypothetical protein